MLIGGPDLVSDSGFRDGSIIVVSATKDLGVSSNRSISGTGISGCTEREFFEGGVSFYIVIWVCECANVYELKLEFLCRTGVQPADHNNRLSLPRGTVLVQLTKRMSSSTRLTFLSPMGLTTWLHIIQDVMGGGGPSTVGWRKR